MAHVHGSLNKEQISKSALMRCHGLWPWTTTQPLQEIYHTGQLQPIKSCPTWRMLSGWPRPLYSGLFMLYAGCTLFFHWGFIPKKGFSPDGFSEASLSIHFLSLILLCHVPRIRLYCAYLRHWYRCHQSNYCPSSVSTILRRLNSSLVPWSLYPTYPKTN